MQWVGKRVLVTGAGGFIGSHLAERLVGLGADVRAFVHYNSSGSWGWLDRSSYRHDLEVVAGEICDRDSLTDAMRGRDVIFHLAALIAIPYSYQAPGSYVQTNIVGTLNVLREARNLSLDAFVQTSTSEVYGTARQVPIAESHTLQGQSPYSASKIGADKIAESFYCSYELPVVTVRPFNTFGPRQSDRAVIPTIIAQCLAESHIKLGNLSPTRDLNYVSNTVDGFVLAGATRAAIGKTINLGSGREISIGRLAKMIAEILGKEVSISSVETRTRPRDSEVQRLLADISLARELLDWQPAVGLREGLQKTIDWVQSNLDKYRPTAYVV